VTDFAKGDRVRVTIEGTVDTILVPNAWIYVVVAGHPALISIDTRCKAVTVERLPPPERPVLFDYGRDHSMPKADHSMPKSGVLYITGQCSCGWITFGKVWPS